MNSGHVIAEMLNAAHGVVQAYHGDLRHDARALLASDTGVFLWSARKNGSYLVTLWRDQKPNIKAAECFSAMSGNYEPAAQWFLATIAGDQSSFNPMTAESACELAWHAKREAEARADHISEINL
jgi:hypothetical protein